MAGGPAIDQLNPLRQVTLQQGGEHRQTDPVIPHQRAAETDDPELGQNRP